MITLLNTYLKEDNSDNQFQVHFYLKQGFQLVQEKIVKIMSNLQGILLLCFKISKLADEGKATIGQIALTKAWVTERAR
jgi:hypothetical protein